MMLIHRREIANKTVETVKISVQFVIINGNRIVLGFPVCYIYIRLSVPWKALIIIRLSSDHNIIMYAIVPRIYL